MNLGFWNVRGLLEPPKQRKVTSFISNNNLDLFGFLETKLISGTLETFKKNYLKDWSFADNFHTACNGRILLTWNQSQLAVNISRVEPQVIQVMVECLSNGNKFQLAMCYSRNHLQDRRQLWDSLIENSDLELPLLVCGDLNNVMEMDE